MSTRTWARPTALAFAALAALAAAAPLQAQHHRHAGSTAAEQQGNHDARGHGGGHGNACTPEHAAMGHCTPDVSGASGTAGHDHAAKAPAQHGSGGTTSVQAGGHVHTPPDATAHPHHHPHHPQHVPVPPLSEADRAAAFPVLAHHSMTHASPPWWKVEIERLEAWDRDAASGQAWEAGASIGGDVHTLRLASEGERSGGRTGSAEVELLYGRGITPWWDLLAGVRQETRPASRSWLAIGIEGTAPGLVEVRAMAHVGSGGQLRLELEAGYDIRFSDRLILQPLVEANAALEDEAGHGIGSGLGAVEAGLRLRYEFHRRFAPYLGVVHERHFGGTADALRASGDDVRDTRVVVGVHAWF